MIQSSVLYLQRLKVGIRLRYCRKCLVILVGTALWASLVSTPGCVEAPGAQPSIALLLPPNPSARTALKATGSCSGRRTLLLLVTEWLPPTPTPARPRVHSLHADARDEGPLSLPLPTPSSGTPLCFHQHHCNFLRNWKTAALHSYLFEDQS